LPPLDGDTLAWMGWGDGAAPAEGASGELEITCPGGGGVMPGSVGPPPIGAAGAPEDGWLGAGEVGLLGFIGWFSGLESSIYKYYAYV
jgi:hypothetical protein